MGKLGNINGFVVSTAWIAGRSFTYDGTTKGLVKSAVANGAKVGSKIKAAVASRLVSNARSYVIISAPHDDRCGGLWADEAASV